MSPPLSAVSPAVGLGSPRGAGVTPFSLVSPPSPWCHLMWGWHHPLIPSVTCLGPSVTHHRGPASLWCHPLVPAVTHCGGAGVTPSSLSSPCCGAGVALRGWCHPLFPSVIPSSPASPTVGLASLLVPSVTPSSPASPHAPSITSCPQRHPLVPTTATTPLPVTRWEGRTGHAMPWW